jgi:DNA-binding transcriptional regulator YdaS (Cro superfamily)
MCATLPFAMTPLQQFQSSKRGNLAELARELGVDKSTVTRWAAGQVPVERVNDVSRITGIPRHELRPDIFGEAAA